MDYQKQATDFLEKTKTTFKAEFVGFQKHFDTDTEKRDVYEITLTREGKKPFVFRFGQSIANSGETETIVKRDAIRGRYTDTVKKGRTAPTAYDVLAGLTKYDPETLEDFCVNYGYDEDSKTAEKIYFAVQKEYSNVLRLFGDVMEELQEIQ